MRHECANASKRSPRASAISVMPAASAIAHGGGRRRGDRDQHRRARWRDFLHHARSTPGSISSMAPVGAPIRRAASCADQLVERVVAADVLARERRCRSPGRQKPAAWTARVSSWSGCSRAAPPTACEPRVERVIVNADRGDARGSGRIACVEAVDAAEPAADRPRHASGGARPAAPRPRARSHIRASMPAGRARRPRRRRCRRASAIPSVRVKPKAKSSRSAGRRHHHGLGARRCRRARPASPRAGRAFARPRARRGRGRRPWDHGCRACPIIASLRRGQDAARQRPPARRSLPATPMGPFEGVTCTAVTLYSGQLVAQSEKSVVITLACVSGWWKVV